MINVKELNQSDLIKKYINVWKRIARLPNWMETKIQLNTVTKDIKTA